MGHFDTLIHVWRGLTAVVYGRMQHECVHSPVWLHAELWFFGITLSLSDCSVLGLREQICGAKTIIACGEGSASRMIDVGRGWVFAVIPGLSVRGQGDHWCSPVCSQAPQTLGSVGIKLNMKVQSGTVCFRVCVRVCLSVQTRLVPDLWPWLILAVGCVMLASYSPTLYKNTVKTQSDQGISLLRRSEQNQANSKCCKYRCIDRKIPQKGKILSFLSWHFPIFSIIFIRFSLVSASLLFICLIPAFHMQMYFGRRCRDSTGLTWVPVQQGPFWEVCLKLSLQKWVSIQDMWAIQDMHMGGCFLQFFFFFWQKRGAKKSKPVYTMASNKLRLWYFKQWIV